MVNGIMVEISSNVGHKEYIGVCVPRPCMCVLALGNFVVIILGYTANAGARRVPSVPSVCHCIDDELTRKGEEERGVGREKERHGYRHFFFGSHCMVLDLVFIQTE